MSTFLQRILSTKADEVKALLQRKVDVRSASDLPICRGFAGHIQHTEGLAVVAEIKKASPSKGLIQPDFRPLEQAKNYENAGACAISVLTDVEYFQGSIEDLKTVRNHVSLPVLRKDFIIHEVQIDEARMAGADAILLICAALQKEQLVSLSIYAQSLGLDVLIEVHETSELDAALVAKPSVVGINNRDLHTFQVHLETTERVMREIPTGYIVISESGIFTNIDAKQVADSGVDGVLVGESLMRGGSDAEVISALQGLRVPRCPRQTVGSKL